MDKTVSDMDPRTVGTCSFIIRVQEPNTVVPRFTELIGSKNHFVTRNFVIGIKSKEIEIISSHKQKTKK